MKTTKRAIILLAILATIGAAGSASGSSPPLRHAQPAQLNDKVPASGYWPALARKRLRLLSVREHRIVRLLVAIHKLRARPAAGGPASASGRASSGWVSGSATWYGPGFYGHSPACGGPGLTESSWWVATVPARCGANVTVCASTCITAPVRDTGAFPSSNLDLTPAVARALGGTYTHRVRWHFG